MTLLLLGIDYCGFQTGWQFTICRPNLVCCLLLCGVRARNVLSHFKWWGKVKGRIIFHDMGKIHELQISVATNEFFMLHSDAHSFTIIYGCFVLQGQSTKLRQTQYGPQRLKYLLFGPFERSFADPWSHPSAFFSAAECPLHFLLSCPCSCRCSLFSWLCPYVKILPVF